MLETTILCLDIGSGTQDALLYRPGQSIENSPKFVLPAPAKMVGKRIAACTAAGRGVYLHGENMGGGFWRALRPHMKAGLGVAAHPEAALALGDDLDRLRNMGVNVTESAPAGYHPVHLCDFSPAFWQTFLGHADLPAPDLILAAVQDHGYHPKQSNRIGRFNIWNAFLLQHEGRPEELLFTIPPREMTRLATVQKAAGNAMVADTGAAAVLGALCDQAVQQCQNSTGATVLNIGNSHIIAFLLHRGRILGVYEHHTGMRDADQLLNNLRRFRQADITNQEVLDSGGHGCVTLDLPEMADAFAPLFVLGPQRALLQGRDAQFPAPGGDMMLMGCFGLLKGYAMRNPELELPF